MRAFRTTGALSFLIVLASSPAAHAAARVFVSVTGSDANDCSNVNTPCRTFNGGITQVDAGGEVIVLTTGSYAGATVNKSVRINVPSGVVAFSASPIVVAAGASDSVAIRGVTLKALTPLVGSGINFQSGKQLSIESCVIDSWGTGIFVGSADSPSVYVFDTILRNGAIGLDSFVGSGSATIAVQNSRFENHSGCAVSAGARSTISAEGTTTSGGVGFGFCASAFFGPATLNCQNCFATGHALEGFRSDTGGTLRVSHSMATKNGTGFGNLSSTFESLGNNLVAGNTTDTSGTITMIAGK